MRQRRQRHVELVERAQRAERELERERRLAAAEERTRIARDLHDSAGHAINVILVQAGAARLLQGRDPDAARAALKTIEDVARETIGEIDVLVRGLREDRDAEVSRRPALPRSTRSLARHRAAGLAIDRLAPGTSRSSPRGVDQAAYRILQESLTNAARHGEGAARVELHFGDARPRADDHESGRRDRARATGGGGHGIVGMRERASLLGGTLDAAPGRRRFLVHARLPRPRRRRDRRVLLVDDDDLMRAGLKAVLVDRSGVEVVGEAGNGVPPSSARAAAARRRAHGRPMPDWTASPPPARCAQPRPR